MNRIKELRKARGLSLEKVAQGADTTKGQIQKLENGTRRLTQEWMERIAPVLGCKPFELIWTDDVKEPFELSNIESHLQVKGKVAAGQWLEVSLMDDDKYQMIPVDRIEKYSGRQYALRVEGDSIDKYARDGEYIICLAFADLGREVKTGDLVVVERTDSAGRVEATVKRVRVAGSRVELWPESTNPKLQNKIVIDNGDPDVEVRITGLVIGHIGID